MDDVVVLNIEANPIFSGTVEMTSVWLEENPSNAPRWVHFTETNDVLTESHYLDIYGL